MKNIYNTRELVPLIAYVYDISATGNLTIVFNKPILIPFITMTSGPNARRLEDEDATIEINSPYYYKIEDLIELKIESDFYTDESEEIGIKNYTLTRITERALDIQIQF